MPANAAIAIHAFYPDVFASMLGRIEGLPEGHALYVTTVAEHRDLLDRTLAAKGRPYRLRVVENRGRDVLPFLEILPELQGGGVETVIKIHTKKSVHRQDGEQWLDDVLSQLLDPGFISRAQHAFAATPALGMIGPHRHYLQMSAYLGANAERVLSIGSRLGLTEPEIMSQGFFGGTMFMARVSAFEPLLRLGFTREDFEPEAGQRDGTLAHALERAMALSVIAQRQRISSTADLTAPASHETKYAFAKADPAPSGTLGGLQDFGRRFERSIRRLLRGGTS